MVGSALINSPPRMTLAPRFLVNLWFGFHVARLNRRLTQPGAARHDQARILARLIAASAKTHYGRHYGLTATSTYARFRAQVPPTHYRDYAALIARMVTGEPDVLVPGRCGLFVESAGTTEGAPKLLPVPETMRRHYRQSLRDAVCLHTLRAGHRGVFHGRHWHHGASPARHEIADGHYRTSLEGLLSRSLSPWAKAHLLAPADPLARLPAGPEKNAAIARAMLKQEVSLLAGVPADIEALAQAACELAHHGKSRPAPLQTLWPRLECFLHLGTPLGIHTDTLRARLGPSVHFHELYAAAEGIFAAQDNLKPAGLRLLSNHGLFFEFLPLAHYHPATLASAGERCLPLGEVQTGVDYLLLVTTPAGLCRYVVGDVVRFLSLDPPRVQFISRLNSQLNLCGEQVSERELSDTLVDVCRQGGWQPVNFHVAPYTQRVAAGQTLSCHEWWVELHTHTLKTPTANVLGPGFDAGLRARNPDYAARRAHGTLAEPCVRLVMPGLFAQWAQQQPAGTPVNRLPHSRSDRRFADQLAALAGFHAASAPTFSPGHR